MKNWKRNAVVAAVLVFGVYGTGYDPQDFIYFKF